MMKKLLFLLCTTLFISCSSDDIELNRTELDTKDLYLQSNLPKILELNQSEINHFKKYMVLNERGVLTSWDGDFLEKVYGSGEEYKSIIVKIYNDLDINPTQIIIVDTNNNERIINLAATKASGSKYSPFKREDPYVREIRGASNRQNNDDGCFAQENSTCIIVVKEIKPIVKFSIDGVQ
ncbi:hypothetical protein [Myroides odoratus]|uniref:Lipoprotein n=2 Tax=Myroides odoratus TaxID=256 RepID=A0A378U1P0_MYROD|nr:hypothetical protein [Myroides odoratus]STZ69175.1 Uncharacterised protein [Myroides odoratus]